MVESEFYLEVVSLVSVGEDESLGESIHSMQGRLSMSQKVKLNYSDKKNFFFFFFVND